MGGNVEAYFEAKAGEEALERANPGRRARFQREAEKRARQATARRLEIRQQIHEQLMELSVEVLEIDAIGLRHITTMEYIRKKMIDILALTNEFDSYR